ncbi:MAG: ferrochelatase [Propionicimonas sp.]|uniref:ferrochelatase n=1 Tax=Propionicimonas sp. TaxID=1955623 RepID=UPI003D0AED5C
MSTSLKYDAVLLMGFGGPEGTEEVVPFLERVTAGRGIPRERLVEVGQHYFTLGGVSPINAQNRALRAALADALRAQGVDIETVLANRNSPPFVPDVLADLAGRGHRRVLAVATAAYAGYSSCRQYREDLGLALADGQVDVDARKLPPFYDLPAFVGAITELLLASLPADLDLAPDSTRLVFTTHSIPTVAARNAGPEGDAYLTEHRWVAARVVEAIAAATGVAKPWDLVFQSRSGPPQVPWLEPDVNDALREFAASGTTDVVLVPIGFISDHMEVIWDLDTQAQETAAELGVRLIRTPTVGTHPGFVADLAARIATELRTGSPEPGPGQFCFGGCCANPRRDAPVAPGLAQDPTR